jgi:MEMO1 family protein
VSREHARRVREPAVAGTFYPARTRTLAETVDELLGTGTEHVVAPKALVVPHAGYAYSGPIAATGYRVLSRQRAAIRRVILLGPAHRVSLVGLAAPSVDAFRTPLGDVPVDRAARDLAITRPAVSIDDRAHAAEHSLEVHLPFLQRLLDSFAALPLVVGHATPAEVSDVLDALWGGPETLIVISSDLSHYEDHDSAVRHDSRTIDAVVAGDIDGVGPYDACGAAPLRGLMLSAARRGLEPLVLDRRTSGDTAGPRDRVVGYAALAYASSAVSTSS